MRRTRDPNALVGYHIRRRLSAAEEARVGPVVDIRGTEEARRRYLAVRGRLPESALKMAEEELASGPG